MSPFRGINESTLSMQTTTFFCFFFLLRVRKQLGLKWQACNKLFFDTTEYCPSYTNDREPHTQGKKNQTGEQLESK